jgi:hypothetical protein
MAQVLNLEAAKQALEQEKLAIIEEKAAIGASLADLEQSKLKKATVREFFCFDRQRIVLALIFFPVSNLCRRIC